MSLSRLLPLFLLLSLIVLCGCEGDEGPAGVAGTDGTDGTNGTDGIDGNVTCLECHNTDLQNSISLQYDRSQHAVGEFVEYASAVYSSCSACHAGNGFVEYMETGTIDGQLLNPSTIGCNHCHSVHTTFEIDDYALRGSDSAPFRSDVGHGDAMFDLGDNSNVCANCHQARTAEPNTASPGDTFEITSTHYGPHHAPNANIYEGVLFAEIPGSTSYPTVPFGHFDADVTCVTCHMGEYSDGAGGHTWHPNINACTSCHSGSTDFDIGGVQANTAALLADLQDLLEDQGIIEFVVEDDAWEPIVGTHSMVQAQAFFNWIGLTEDRSLGVHNPPYVEALLLNSIEALTPVN